MLPKRQMPFGLIGERRADAELSARQPEEL